MTEITDAVELAVLHAQDREIGTPFVFSFRAGGRITFWANSDDLRDWRSHSTSGSEGT